MNDATSTSTSTGHLGDLDETAAPSHAVIRRSEMIGATLNVGGQPIDLSEYATTGIVGVGVGPRGCGKTNVGQLIGEQLADQGWQTILFDPENEQEQMYGEAVSGPEELRHLLMARSRKIVVVRAANAG